MVYNVPKACPATEGSVEGLSESTVFLYETFGTLCGKEMTYD